MLNTMTNQLTDLVALARPAFQSFEAMLMQSIPMRSNPTHSKRPALVPAPVKSRGRQVSSVSCDRGYQAIAGITATAAVRMHADPVTEGWRSLDFGTTETGNTAHSQPSRFAT